MPCTSPKACPCPAERCVPWGVASGVHTSSRFAGLRNRDKRARQACVPSPACSIRAYIQLSEIPTSRQRPCAQSLGPWPHQKQSRERLGTPKGSARHLEGRPDGCGCVWPPPSWRPQLLGLHHGTNAKMVLLAGPWGPVSPPNCAFLINSSSVHKNDLSKQEGSQYPRVLFVPFDT